MGCISTQSKHYEKAIRKPATMYICICISLHGILFFLVFVLRQGCPGICSVDNADLKLRNPSASDSQGAEIKGMGHHAGLYSILLIGLIIIFWFMKKLIIEKALRRNLHIEVTCLPKLWVYLLVETIRHVYIS